MYSTITLKKTAGACKRFFASLLLLFFITGSLKAQYCAAGANTTDEIITNVTLGTINNTSTSAPGLYSDYSAQSTTALAGSTVSFSVSYAFAYSLDRILIWVDFNNNQNFTDVGEMVYTSAPGISPATGTFTIPAGTTAGPKRIRIRLDYNNASLSPCGSPTYGEVEDYTLNVTANTPCTGTPSPGNTLSTVSTICPGLPFTLSLQNTTAGSGVTYQYQSSPTGAPGTFTNIGGATNATYTVAAGITATTYYQAIVTCGGGTNSGTSTPVMVALTPPSGCYCTSNATNVADEDVFNVTIGTLNNSSNCTSVGPGPGSMLSKYANYTSLPAPSLVQGSPYTLSVSAGTCGTFNFTNSLAVWIDFNQNGAFDPTERVFATASGAGAHTETTTITIPVTAPLGTTRMRVIVDEIANSATIPVCGTYAYGETEDYNVTIVPCVPLAVTTAPASQTVTCGGNATFTAAITGSNPTYQWQIQTAPGVFTNLANGAPYSGVNTNTLTVTGVTTAMSGNVYRLLYTGACTSTNFSAPVTLTVTPIAATFTQTPSSLCAGGTGTQAITVTGGGTGVFTPSTGLYTDAAGTIPYTGTAVTTVYARPTATTTYSLVRTNGACVSNAATVTVTVNAPIAGTPTLNAQTNICSSGVNGSTTLSVSGITGGTALSYQFQVSTDGGATYNNITNGTTYSGATTPTLTINNATGLISGTMYRVVVSSASCGNALNSNASTLSVNPVPVVTISSIPNGSNNGLLIPGAPATISTGVASGTGPFTYQYFLNNTSIGGNSATIPADPNFAGSLTVRVTDAKGCVGTSNSTSLLAIASTQLFIYPSPNNGTFQVRYFNGKATSLANDAATVNVFDSKGSRVFTYRYAITGPYTQMNVVLGSHGSGIYRVELTDNLGNRLKTGSVFVF